MKALLLPSVLALFVVSCASHNPASRAEKYPERFANLNTSEQEEVQQGRISEGMSKDGVFIALGNPDNIINQLENGTETEEWSYYTLTPTIRQNFGFGIGYGGYGGHGGFRGRRGYGGFGGYGHSGRFGSRYSSFLYSPQINYSPSLSAVVEFDGDYVSSYKVRKSR